MHLFGRSKHHLETLAAEFLPFDQQLHMIAADADMNLQVMQFDPERPSPCAPSLLNPQVNVVQIQNP
jgi:cleavage and polyadenylation specificity factor subunit 1